MTDRLGIICNAPLTPGRRSLAHSARGCALALLSRRDHFVAELWLITFYKLEANPFVKKGNSKIKPISPNSDLSEKTHLINALQ